MADMFTKPLDVKTLSRHMENAGFVSKQRSLGIFGRRTRSTT